MLRSRRMSFPRVERRVDAYFSYNRISKCGNRLVWFKIVLVLMLFAGTYSLLVSDYFSRRQIFCSAFYAA